MTKRSHTLVFTLVITTTIMLFPSTARLQEKTESAATEKMETAAPEKTETAAPEKTETATPEKTETATPEKTETATPEKTETATPEKTESAAPESGIYIVVKGDTLWDISNSLLKDPFLWPLIWKENPFIKNPDLIYPGNKLTIPSLAMLERAMQAPAEAAPPEGAEKAGTKAPPATATPAPPTAAPAQAEEPVKRGLILEQGAVHPLIDKYTMLSASYVSTDTWEESIAGALEPKSMLGYDDIVFIKVNAPENVNIGDKYLIVAPVKKVKHPQTGKKMGRLIKVLGILQVIEKAPGAAYLTAQISLSFDTISKGSLLAPYQEPMLIYSVPQNDGRSIDGHVMEVMDSRSINGTFDLLFLDKGGNDGVKPGDRFMVFIDPLKKGFPRKIIGEAQVVLVKDTTATALVKSSKDTIAKGDRVELIK